MARSAKLEQNDLDLFSGFQTILIEIDPHHAISFH
jgi:hypothetical protein